MSRLTTRLFSLIKKCYNEIAWDKCGETQIVGIHLPKEKEPSFIVISGKKNDKKGFLIYHGYRELAYAYQYFHTKNSDMQRIDESAQNCTAIYFKDRNDLTKKEYDTIKASGIAFRGRNAWPVVMDHSPGYVSTSYANINEMWLYYVLSTFYDMAGDYRLEETVFSEFQPQMIRTIPGRRYANDSSYEDIFFEVPEWVIEGVSAEVIGRRPTLVSRFELLRLYQTPSESVTWEMTIELVEESIELTEDGQRIERPFYPGFFVVADNSIREILLMDVINEHEVVSMQRQLMRLFLDADMRPKTILVKKEHYAKLEAYFGEFFAQLDIQLKTSDGLPTIELIKSELDSLSFFN